MVNVTRRAKGVAAVAVAVVAIGLCHAGRAGATPLPLTTPLEPEVSYPRLSGGFRVPIGVGVGSLRGGVTLGLSARAGAELGSLFGVYGELGGQGAFYGGLSASAGGAVASMLPYAAVLGAFKIPQLELSFGPAAGPFFPFPQGRDGVGARFGALARLTWIAVPARKSTGFHYAPSFEMLALGGPQGSKRWEATVAATVSFIGFEWY